MALNIKSSEVERLATEVAALAGENKTVAIGKALEERKARLLASGTRLKGADRFGRWLEKEYWAKLRGRAISLWKSAILLGKGHALVGARKGDPLSAQLLLQP